MARPTLKYVARKRRCLLLLDSVRIVKALIAPMFGVEPEQFRVVTPDVGGGFGMKLFLYPEQVLVLYAVFSRQLIRGITAGAVK